jgi:hypothetical protein
MNAADHQNILVQFDFPDGLGFQPFLGSVDLTRLQRASEGSGQSTGGCGHYVVQRRGVRF